MTFFGVRSDHAYRQARVLLLGLVAAAFATLGCSDESPAPANASATTGSGGSGAATASSSSAGGAGDGGASTGGSGDGGSAPWTWEAGPAMPEARQSAGCVEHAGTIYAIGGLALGGGTGAPIDGVAALDVAEGTWLPRAPLPVESCCFGAATVGDRIYVAGGYEADGSTPSDQLFVYDPAADEWQTGPSMPTARAIAAAIDWDGKLAVLGGRAVGGSPTGVVEIFDPATQSWSSSAAFPTGREAAAAGLLDGTVVVAGGYPELSAYGTDLVEVYDGAWSNGPSMINARGQLAFAAVEGSLVLAGGWGPMGHSAAAERLEAGASGWQPLPDLPTARAGACAATAGGQVWVIGGGEYGAGGWQSLAVVEVLTAR